MLSFIKRHPEDSQAISNVKAILRNWQEVDPQSHFIPTAAQYLMGKTLAKQNTLLRLVYATFTEAILLKNTEVIVLHIPREPDLECKIPITHPDQLLPIMIKCNTSEYISIMLKQYDRKTIFDDPIVYWNEVIVPTLKTENISTAENILAAQRELLNSIENETLSMAGTLAFSKGIRLGGKGCSNMWDWLLLFNQENAEVDPCQSPELSLQSSREQFLERFSAFKGHPTHPMAKMLGRKHHATDTSYSPLTISELIQFSPEFGIQPSLHWISVEKSLVQAVSDKGPVEILDYLSFVEKTFPTVFNLWKEQYRENQLTHFVPLPIHPLQLPEICKQFPHLMKECMIHLPGIQDKRTTFRPTISMRTLLDSKGWSMKLPLALQKTTVVRTISPARAHNGPLISGLIKFILDHDPYFSSGLDIVEEVMSIYLKHGSVDSKEYLQSYHMNVVYKSPMPKKEDSVAIPIAGLLQLSPFTNKALILDILAHQHQQDPESVWDFFTTYVGQTIRNDVGMFARYGISYESHQQNTLLRFDEEGRYITSVYRDFSGGVEIYQPIFESNTSLPESIRNVSQLMHELPKGFFNKAHSPLKQLIHTTFRLQLFPIMDLLIEEFELDEKAALTYVYKCVEKEIMIAQQQHIKSITQTMHTSYLDFLCQLKDSVLFSPYTQKGMFTARLKQEQQASQVGEIANRFNLIVQ